MENEDLLGGETVDETVETAPLEGVDASTSADIPQGEDASPEVSTEGAKSVAEAIDFGLNEVNDRHAGKKAGSKSGSEEGDADAVRPKNADGTFKSDAQIAAEKSGEKTALPTVEEKAAAKAKAEKDAVEAEIPATVAPKTRERMQTLIDVVKDKDAQIAQHQSFVDAIAATGATPAEFQTMMAYQSAIHSDNPEHLKLAQNLLLSELEAISLKLGTPAPGVDFLSKYPDLQAQVERGEIRREAATELAITRTKAKNLKDSEDRTRAAGETAAATQKERDEAQAELTKFGDELFKRDGAEYQRRYAILEPALEALGMLPPKQWKAAFLRAYNAIPAVKPVAPTLPNGKPAAAAATPPKGQPLRPNKTPSGESAQGPKSLFEAIDGALKGM